MAASSKSTWTIAGISCNPFSKHSVTVVDKHFSIFKTTRQIITEPSDHLDRYLYVHLDSMIKISRLKQNHVIVHVYICK